MHALQKLATKHDIICLQEVHGTEGDHASLVNNFQAFLPFFSPGAEPGIGGVAILVRRSLVGYFSMIRENIIEPGRALAVHLEGEQGVLCLYLFMLTLAFLLKIAADYCPNFDVLCPDHPSLPLQGTGTSALQGNIVHMHTASRQSLAMNPRQLTSTTSSMT